MFTKITSVAALPDYILLVGFSDESFKQFDVKPLIEKYQPFKALVNIKGLYEQVKIDLGGYGLIWNDELDLSADGLYEQGVPCNPPTDIDRFRKQLIEELINARKKAKLSQKQLEILSGIAQPCIARTETGTTDPKLTTLLKMLEPLGLTLSITSI